MNQARLKKLLILNLLYVPIGLYATKLGEAWRMAEGADMSKKLLHLMDGFAAAFHSPWPSFVPADLLLGIALGCLLRLIVYEKGRNAKKYRHNVEYGSARWGKPGDIQPFIDPDPWNNVILTKTERLTMNSRPKNPQYARNKNVLVIGGSGSGKTRFFVKPNIMQCTKTKGTSLVVTDPKGTLVVECGKMLVAAGYDVRILNTINFKKSMHYNSLSYIHSETDILKLVTALIANTKGEGKAGEDFWVKAETLLYIALIGYIHYELPPEKQNFATLIDMLDKMQVREDDEDFRNEIDEIFDDLAQRKPEHFAVRQYQKYKMASGKTAKSILVSCGARLAVFDIEELREITSYDELSLDTIGDKRTALFLIMSDTDATFNFLISLAYSQLFNLLCEKADDEYGGRLPVHALIGNWDRHNGNWGFLYYSDTDRMTLAPIYDCGSCLYPQADEAIMQATLDDPDERNYRIFEVPVSGIRENNQKIRYFDFISSLKNRDCNEALKRMVPRIHMDEIAALVDNTPFITGLQKQFYKTMLTERKERILDFSLTRLLKRERKREAAR